MITAILTLFTRVWQIFEWRNFLLVQPVYTAACKFCRSTVYMSPYKFLWLVSTLELLLHQLHVTRLQVFTAQTKQKVAQFRCEHESA